MDVKDAVPALVVFDGMRLRACSDLPPGSMMLVRPVYTELGALDYAATVQSSVLIEGVVQA